MGDKPGGRMSTYAAVVNWPEAVGLDEYQKKASATAIYPNFLAVVYPTIKMGGESGEALEKVGKWLRGDTGPLDKEALMMEYGDVLWYIANGLKDLGYTLSECANANLKKVYQRKQQGLTKGSGDDREKQMLILREALESISGMADAQDMIDRADAALNVVTNGEWGR